MHSPNLLLACLSLLKPNCVYLHLRSCFSDSPCYSTLGNFDRGTAQRQAWFTRGSSSKFLYPERAFWNPKIKCSLTWSSRCHLASSFPSGSISQEASVTNWIRNRSWRDEKRVITRVFTCHLVVKMPICHTAGLDTEGFGLRKVTVTEQEQLSPAVQALHPKESPPLSRYVCWDRSKGCPVYQTWSLCRKSLQSKREDFTNPVSTQP